MSRACLCMTNVLGPRGRTPFGQQQESPLLGCFPLCYFRKFRSEFKWKGPFRFLPTGIFEITSGLISVGRPKFMTRQMRNVRNNDAHKSLKRGSFSIPGLLVHTYEKERVLTKMAVFRHGHGIFCQNILSFF